MFFSLEAKEAAWRRKTPHLFSLFFSNRERERKGKWKKARAVEKTACFVKNVDLLNDTHIVRCEITCSD